MIWVWFPKSVLLAGSILFDRDDNPVFSFSNDSSTTKYFLTDADENDIDYGDSNQIILDKLQLDAVAGEPLSKHQCVLIGNDGMIYLASRNNIISESIGITDKDYAMGDKVKIIKHGFVINREDWNWSLPENTLLFVGANGE